ncbi:hypothetical protein MYP_1655 [Sporocytophaga myxococcoides]|uniref:Uncharacterized protein n=1 Tax=Sporocytophaga myxococcoides TaxID=153721 RepID=A0A098LDC2_9BACT|nr:hypothetical protein MYP_1655 [Sporocytophaga myxococcoides]
MTLVNISSLDTSSLQDLSLYAKRLPFSTASSKISDKTAFSPNKSIFLGSFKESDLTRCFLKRTSCSLTFRFCPNAKCDISRNNKIKTMPFIKDYFMKERIPGRKYLIPHKSAFSSRQDISCQKNKKTPA